MPYKQGEAASLEDLISQLIIWATDTAIHGDDAWTLMQNEAWPKGTILRAKGLDGKNSCYIGLMVLDFTSSTAYSSWLLQTEVIAKKIVWAKSALNKPGANFTHTSGAASFAVWNDALDTSKGTVTYTLSGHNNLVKSYGKCLVFGVFKQFTDGLNWDEQPGAINTAELDLDLYPLFYTKTGSTSQTELAPPVYPGWGYPGISLPSGEPSADNITYWLIKDNSHLTVVTRNGIQWDMGHAGLLEPFEAVMQYPFPAVVAGTCTGLSIVGESTVVNGTRKVVKGNKIDYSYSNWSMSRSLPLAPCENGVSQLALCLPDGTWTYFSNWTQELQNRSYSSSSTVTSYYFTVERPVRESNTADGYRIKPTNVELTGVAPCLSSDDTITLEPLQLIQNDSANYKVDLFGSLWGMSWPGTDLPFGEITVNGKACLLIPNCWEDRLWYVIPWTNSYVEQSSYFSQYKEILKYGKQFKMLIELEV
ncbi:hypothetical protein [Sporomusa aerivorans]|uniref:hypothetical protein n=1 Tax=Sporomusa aerivorans TaxID=204936 RepID=UPI00352B8436